MAKPTTLTDVAKALGVAPSTVQRALSGSPGVSEKRREEIRKTAHDMGYQRNAMATLLKASNRKIAVVLPEKGYYSRELWNGVTRFWEENSGFGFEVLEYTYRRSPQALAEALEEADREHGNALSGVITMGEPAEPVQEILRRWHERNIPVVLVGTDMEPQYRLACVQGSDELAGMLAADLLLFGTPSDSMMKILVTGDFSIADQYYNMQGFERRIMQSAPRYEILKYGDQAEASVICQNLCDYYEKHPDLTAVYSTSARNTIAVCEAAMKTESAGSFKLIGSDLFEESRSLLQSSVLDAVIHKRPAQQAYRAAQTLFGYILHGTLPAEDVLRCDPVIVMRSNADCGDE